MSDDASAQYALWIGAGSTLMIKEVLINYRKTGSDFMQDSVIQAAACESIAAELQFFPIFHQVIHFTSCNGKPGNILLHGGFGCLCVWAFQSSFQRGLQREIPEVLICYDRGFGNFGATGVNAIKRMYKGKRIGDIWSRENAMKIRVQTREGNLVRFSRMQLEVPLTTMESL